MLRQGRIVVVERRRVSTPRRCLITIYAGEREKGRNETLCTSFGEFRSVSSSRLASNENAHRRKGTRPDLFSPDSPIFLALAIARLAKEKHTGSRLCTLVRRSEADCCHHRDPRPRGPHQCLNIRS